MGVSKSLILFARIHFDWKVEDFKDVVSDLLQNKFVYEKGKFAWTLDFDNTGEVKKEGYLFGRLLKVKRKPEGDFFDFKTKRAEYDIPLNKSLIVDHSDFIIYPTTTDQIIAFEERKNRISKYQFSEFFRENYYHFRKGKFRPEIRIDFLFDEEEIFTKLKSFDLIVEANFELRPSNPDDSPLFKPLDESIKATGAKKAHLKYINREDGLTVNDTVIEQAIHQSSAANGNFEIRGKKGDRIEQIRSKDNIKSCVVERLKDPKSFIKEIFNHLKQKILSSSDNYSRRW